LATTGILPRGFLFTSHELYDDENAYDILPALKSGVSLQRRMAYQRSIHLRSKLRSVLECCYKYKKVDEELRAKISPLAVRAFRGLHHRDYAKFDIRIEEGSGISYFTDSNPNTAFGPDMGLPMTEVMALNGISFQETLVSLLADPYKKFAGLDRKFRIRDFAKRWWDVNEVTIPGTKRKNIRYDRKMLFVVTPKKALFPKKLGMVRSL